MLNLFYNENLFFYYSDTNLITKVENRGIKKKIIR